MPKRKNLNGIPHNLTKSYFSTLRYTNGGYMADWLLHSAKKLHVNIVTLDILYLEIIPKEMEALPLMDHLIEIKKILHTELEKNGFDYNFIIQAKITVEIPDTAIYANTIYCYPELTDIDGRLYKHGRIIESAYELNSGFPRKHSLLEFFLKKVKRFFKLR